MIPEEIVWQDLKRTPAYESPYNLFSLALLALKAECFQYFAFYFLGQVTFCKNLQTPDN